jgi:hypothetical protein
MWTRYLTDMVQTYLQLQRDIVERRWVLGVEELGLTRW